MELKPGYKETEVGVIPEEWEVVPFSELLEFRNGVNADKHAYGKGLPFINVLEVITKPHLQAADIPGRVSLSKSRVDSFVVRRGDLVFNRTSETQEEVGLSSVYLDDIPVVFGGFVIRGQPTGNAVDPVYSGYAFRAPAVRAQIVARGQGAIRANVGQSDLRQVLAPLPPLPEQRAIAGALGDVDALLGALTQLIAKKRNLKQAAMQQLLTGHTRLPGFHGEWEVKRFGDLFSFSGGLSASREQLSDSGLCYLHYGDIHNSTKSFINVNVEFIDIPKLDVPLSEVSASARLQDGDVVFVDASEDDEGTSRHLVIVNPGHIPYISGLHTIVAKSRTGALDNRYKRYCFQSQNVKDQFRFYAAGTKVSGISKTSIAKIFLTYPPSVSEQTAIATVLSEVDAELAALEQRLAKTRALKQGMMQELLTGRTRLV